NYMDIAASSSRAYEDMYRHEEIWKRLIEKIHPMEKRFQKFAFAQEIVKKFYKKDELLRTTIVGEAIKNKDMFTLMQKAYSGELARLIDFILREGSEKEINAFMEKIPSILSEVSTPMLFQILGHFRSRDAKDYRVFLPKGQAQKAVIKPNIVKEINETIKIKVLEHLLEAIVNRFKELPEMGKVYISPELRNYKIPFSQRSASSMKKVLTRGSSFPIPDKKTFRIFTHWKNSDRAIDVDLSASFFDEKYELVDHISWTNLKSKFSVHSGDITNAPLGATEYIDIDLEKTRKAGVRYIVPLVLSYSTHLFCDIPECFAGWIATNNPQKGDTYKPKLVENIYDITSPARRAMPYCIDLKENKIIWTDFIIKHEGKVTIAADWGDGNVIERSISSIVKMAIAASELNKIKESLYMLFLTHVTARNGILLEELPNDFDAYKEQKNGIFVKETDEEITQIQVFDVDIGITPFDIDSIVGGYLV
ncbi:MAG: TerD family protein, partial [Atribacterota bacterium]